MLYILIKTKAMYMTYSNLKDIELLGSAVTEWNEMLSLDRPKLNLKYGLILGHETETRYLTSMSLCSFHVKYLTK